MNNGKYILIQTQYLKKLDFRITKLCEKGYALLGPIQITINNGDPVYLATLVKENDQ